MMMALLILILVANFALVYHVAALGLRATNQLESLVALARTAADRRRDLEGILMDVRDEARCRENRQAGPAKPAPPPPPIPKVPPAARRRAKK